MKETIKEETLNKWNSKVKDLTMQGDFIQILAEEQENVTWKSIAYNVPKGILPFALKACTNSLNTPDNLKRWGERKFSKCDLCGNHGTLEHILNFCSISLNQGRTKWRHDSVLKHFTSILQQAKPVNIEMFADLPGHWMNGATVPADILCTSERPDVVLVERKLRKIVLLELTCNHNDPHELKYEQLLNGNINEKVAVLKKLQENAEKRTNYLSIKCTN